MEEIVAQIAPQLATPDWIAVYTAIVATLAMVIALGTFGLEIRRWFERGPSLKIDCYPWEKTIYGVAGPTWKTKLGERPLNPDPFLLVPVTNQGNAAATILSLSISIRPTWLSRRIKTGRRTTLVRYPSGDAQPPVLLDPGAVWRAHISQDADISHAIKAGQLWVELHASHRKTPISSKVRLSRAKLVGMEI